MKKLIPLLTILVAACGSGPDSPQATAELSAADAGLAKVAKSAPAATTIKPSGPVSIDYRIIGTPVVGQPVGVELTVRSFVGPEPVRLNYRINDTTAMQFPEAQPKSVSLAAQSGDAPGTQQLRVVPMREGRLYVNVSAAVETDTGSYATAIAIPIQVGAAPARRIEQNGEAAADEDGEAIRVLQGN